MIGTRRGALIGARCVLPNQSAMGGTIVADVQAVQQTEAVLSLIFAKGQRPDCAAVSALAAGAEAGPARFAISHMPADNHGWLELLISGMAIDCRGLAPAPAEPRPASGAILGLGESPDGEAISLHPGPHLADAVAMLPVVRAVAALAVELAALPGLLAVCWNPAQCWMAPAYFRKVIGDWLAGGPFPALGLTSLHRTAQGAMESRGLAFFTGQELQLPAAAGYTPADQARIAVRLINELVGRDALTQPVELTGPAGEPLVIAPIMAEQKLRVILRKGGLV